MVKKIFTILALSVYLMVSTGFIVSLHYCMDQLDSARIAFAGDSDKCGGCGMEQDESGCCREDITVIKIGDTHLASQASAPDFSLPQPILIAREFSIAPFLNFRQIAYITDHGPPLSGQDTYLLNRVFRI